MAKKKAVPKKKIVASSTPNMMLLGYKGKRKNVEYAGKKFKHGDIHPVPANLKNAINDDMKAEGFYIKSTSKTETNKVIDAEKSPEPTHKPSDEESK